MHSSESRDKDRESPPQRDRILVPKVSVVVPNYNHARFLPRRLDSIFAQTWRDFDLLIMDDKSSDDSLAVIARYLDRPNVRLDANERNSGSPYRQWNKALGQVQGDYVWIAESDDYADPRFLEILVDALDRHPSAGIAMCQSYDIDGDDRILRLRSDEWATRPGRVYGPNPFEKGELFLPGREYAERLMTPFNTMPNASGMLFRRDALEAIGGPVTDMKICGDWFTYCKMLMHCDAVVVPDALNYFRTHVSNVRLRTKAQDFIREALTVRAFLEKELGSQPSALARRVALDQYAQMLMWPERPSPQARVPLARFPRVLASAAPFGPALTAMVAKSLLREVAGRLKPGRAEP
jgi:glycosyltransferase involved in cell wall biosynthesis